MFAFIFRARTDKMPQNIMTNINSITNIEHDNVYVRDMGKRLNEKITENRNSRVHTNAANSIPTSLYLSDIDMARRFNDT